MCPMSFCVTVSELSSLLAEAGCGINANGEMVTIVQFIDDNKIFCDDMDGAQRALDVLDKDAHMRGAWYNGTKTVVTQFVDKDVSKTNVTLRLERQKKSSSGNPPGEEIRKGDRWGHREVKKGGETEGAVVEPEYRVTEVLAIEHLGAHECQTAKGERSLEKHGNIRVRKGQVSAWNLAVSGGCNGGIPAADGILALQMGPVMTLMWGCETTGRMVRKGRKLDGQVDPGGVPRVQWRSMVDVMNGAIRRALGGTHGTSGRIMRAEAGIPTLEATTCVAVVRAWGQMKQYGTESKLRRVWERQMKDVKRGITPEAGSMAARTIWAMREIFGKEGAEKMMRADVSKAEYKRRAKEGAVG